jgi:FdhD/NarQ family
LAFSHKRPFLVILSSNRPFGLVAPVLINRYTGPVCTEDQPDPVAVKEPLEIRLGFGPRTDRQQRALAMMMRTPGAGASEHDQELALGFLFTEGIIHHRADILSCRHCVRDVTKYGNVIRVELAENVIVDWARLERNVYTASSCGVCGKASIEAVVQMSRGPMEPVSPLIKSESAIIAGMAKATLGNRRQHGEQAVVNWDDLIADYDRIRDGIARVVPGFTDFNVKVRRYRGIYGERRVVMLHPDDLARCGLVAGSVVHLHSHFQGKTRTAPRFIAVPYDLPRGNSAAYFPETNVLVPIDSQAEGSKTPTSKSIVITLETVLNGAGNPERMPVGMTQLSNTAA